jgi:hypothetical protein
LLRSGTRLAAFGLVMALAVPAQAKKMVYSPVVVEGEKEVEYYVDWREPADGVDVVGHELSVEYAVGARDKLSLYGVFSERAGRTTYDQANLEWIHQVFEQGAHAWDFGTYLEFQVAETGSPQTIEFKALLEHTFPRTTLTLNPVLEQDIGPGAPSTEVGYDARLALRRWRAVEPAVELFGELGEYDDLADWPDSIQLLGPAVDLRLGRHLRWHTGVLWGLTNASEDVRVKTQVAWEWY